MSDAVAIAPAVSPLPKWRLRRVEDYVVANIGERITLHDLAAAAGLSRMHFAAQFRAALGCRPHHYLLARRIEHAKAAMQGGMALAEVALCAGFQTQSHFSTVFKRITGATPGRWRRVNAAEAGGAGPAGCFDLTNLAPASQHGVGLSASCHAV
jgi:AraC family transcriptional regulator